MDWIFSRCPVSTVSTVSSVGIDTDVRVKSMLQATVVVGAVVNTIGTVRVLRITAKTIQRPCDSVCSVRVAAGIAVSSARYVGQKGLVFGIGEVRIRTQIGVVTVLASDVLRSCLFCVLCSLLFSCRLGAWGLLCPFRSFPLGAGFGLRFGFAFAFAFAFAFTVDFALGFAFGFRPGFLGFF